MLYIIRTFLNKSMFSYALHYPYSIRTLSVNYEYLYMYLYPVSCTGIDQELYFVTELSMGELYILSRNRRFRPYGRRTAFFRHVFLGNFPLKCDAIIHEKVSACVIKCAHRAVSPNDSSHQSQ
jgi:hypothetical protein